MQLTEAEKQRKFEERIARIIAGRTGVDDPAVSPRANRQAMARARRHAGGGWRRAPRWFVVGLVLGVLCVAAIRLGRLRQLSEGYFGIEPDRALAMDAAGALALGFVAWFLLPLGGRSTILGLVVGAALGLAGQHNAVHQWPEPFAQVYSESWVREVRHATAPRTLIFRDTVYRF